MTQFKEEFFSKKESIKEYYNKLIQNDLENNDIKTQKFIDIITDKDSFEKFKEYIDLYFHVMGDNPLFLEKIDRFNVEKPSEENIKIFNSLIDNKKINENE